MLFSGGFANLHLFKWGKNFFGKSVNKSGDKKLLQNQKEFLPLQSFLKM
jgi:hypothetical protein